MLIVEILTAIVALVSLGVSLVVATRLSQLGERSAAFPPETSEASALPEPDRPLQGLRIALAITQDHAHPVFANLLKERLLLEDVAEITMADSEDVDADIVIKGEIVGNGYTDIYYQAEFTCNGKVQPICTLIERPPHGDRPSNLAIELVTRLKNELSKLASRTERSQAIRELLGG